MFAEMLGIVCHSEYYSQCDQNVLSFLSLSLISLCFSNPRSRLLSSTLWNFALQYTGPISLLINLRTIHTIGIDKFSATTRIELQHTPSYDLLDPISRTTFLKRLYRPDTVFGGWVRECRTFEIARDKDSSWIDELQ